MKTQRFILAVLALSCMLATLGAELKSEDLAGPAWASWRGPNGNGMVKDVVSPAALTAGKVLWTQNVGPGYAAVHPVGKVAFTSGRVKGDETLFCLDAGTGKVLWQYAIGGDSGDFPGTRSSPLILDGKVYCMNRDGLAYCLNASNGSLVYKSDVAKAAGAQKPQWGFASSPVRFGDLLVFNVGTSGAAIQLATGKLAWKSDEAAAGYASAVPLGFKGQSLAVIFGADTFFVIDPKTGKQLASMAWRTDYDVNAADPLVVGNQILVSSAYNRGGALFEFDGKSLRKVWENKSLRSHFSSMVAIDGYVYANDGDANASSGAFVCLELASGKQLWRQPDGVGSLIVVNDRLLTLTERGRLALANVSPKAYVELAFIERIGPGQYWPAPTIAGGRLYLRNNNGVVTCLNLAD